LNIFKSMKPVVLSTNSSEFKKEMQSSESSQPKHFENAKKIQRLLKKRREMLADQKSKLENEKIFEKPQKPPRTKNDTKDIIVQPKSEPTTSEEYDEDEDEHPETLTENSESYDSNDSLHCDVVAKEITKG